MKKIRNKTKDLKLYTRWRTERTEMIVSAPQSQQETQPSVNVTSWLFRVPGKQQPTVGTDWQSSETATTTCKFSPWFCHWPATRPRTDYVPSVPQFFLSSFVLSKSTKFFRTRPVSKLMVEYNTITIVQGKRVVSQAQQSKSVDETLVSYCSIKWNWIWSFTMHYCWFTSTLTRRTYKKENSIWKRI